jgi:aspartyl protease family protein
MFKVVLFLAGLAVAVAVAVPEFLLGLTDRGEGAIAARAPDATAPASPSLNQGGTVRIPANQHGQYVSGVEINHRRFDALIDTGATLVALRYEDARELGLVFPGDRFDIGVRTANGEGRARRIALRSISVGSATVRDVDALVLEPGALGVNLVGMSFLGRLSRFEVQRGTLVLEP